MTDYILVALVAAIPAISVRMVTPRLIWHAKSVWLLGLTAASAAYLLPREPWLALIALWFLIHWPRHEDPTVWLPSVLQWLGVGLSWFLLRNTPLDYAPIGWVAVAFLQCGLVAYRKVKYKHRQTGTFGSPVLTAMYLALVAPFCPWWGWPILAIGFAITSSYLALVGLAAGMCVLYPWITPYLLFSAVGAAILWLWSPQVYGRRVLEWLPRGDTFDSVVSRWRGWQLILHHTQEKFWTGHGPETMEPALLRWGSRYGHELPWGEAHSEFLHMVYEYGLLGLLAITAFVFRVGPHLRLEDPWSAAFITGCVLAIGHWPLRHVAIGLTFLAISAGVIR